MANLTFAFICLFIVISARAETNCTEGEINPTTPPIDFKSLDGIFQLLQTPTFLYGAAFGACCILIVVFVLSLVYCCLKRLAERKEDLEEAFIYDESGTKKKEKLVSIKCETTEVVALPNTYTDNTEDNLREIEEAEYLVPLEDQNEGQENLYDNATEQRPLDGNPTSPSCVENGEEVVIDVDKDNDEREYSTPFDKGTGKQPIDPTKYCYEGLSRVYENCSEDRSYMNLNLQENEKETDEQSSASKDDCPPSPGYVNVRGS
ncbi:uncharacterized protein [Acropora muricata]|uniref:uncharacterized protein n=1 Tax=Acropora muricata TaxID=159855 RepID=UPI0034E3AE75